MLIVDFDAGLSLAVGLCNTYDTLLEDPELLKTPQDLSTLLREQRFPARRVPTRGDVRTAKKLRSDVHKAFAARTPRSQLTALNALFEYGSPIPKVIAADDGYAMAFEVADDAALVDRIATAIALSLADVAAHYGPERLKVCAALSCHNAFVDLSKNQVGHYCSRLCANRENAAAYRARERRRSR